MKGVDSHATFNFQMFLDNARSFSNGNENLFKCQLVKPGTMGDDLLSLVKFFCGFCKQNWPLQSPLGDDDDYEIKKISLPSTSASLYSLKGNVL